MCRILVIFTCFNRIQKTKKCLESLADNQNCKLDYIVLDDNSTDGTAEFLKTQDNVFLLHGNGHLFYSGGMRMAIEKAKTLNLSQYEYVMFINDDVAFFPNAIDRLTTYENKSNEIIVGAVCNNTGKYSYGGERLISRRKPKYEPVMIDDTNLYCDTTCANCVLMPSNVFICLPNIDPVYRHSMGDLDYFFEANRNGYKIKSSNFYAGECKLNDINQSWRDTSLNRAERHRKKESAKGLPFKEWYHYLRKNHGILSAIYYSTTPYVRILLKK